MDVLAHALYGATLCSRTGLAGGRRGPPLGPKRPDWTVWAAAGFGVLPDIASLGAYFVYMWVRGQPMSFYGIPPYVFTLYHCTHSLIFAGLCVLLVRVVARPLTVPALAWPLHVLMDSVLHDTGHWQSSMLFPLEDWHLPGINWWEHPAVMQGYWLLLPALWLAIHLWRRRARAKTVQNRGRAEPIHGASPNPG